MKLVGHPSHHTSGVLRELRQKIGSGIRPFLRRREELSQPLLRDSISPPESWRNCVEKRKLSRSHCTWVMEPLSRCACKMSRNTESPPSYSRLLRKQLTLLMARAPWADV